MTPITQRIHSKVKVIGNDHLVIRMFKENGYKIILDGHDSDIPDLVCFTGGGDVDPKYYKQKNIGSYGIDQSRDKREVSAYNRYIGTPKVGICRGGQFLNVMSGGRMWQDVDYHGGTHEATDLFFKPNKKLWVTSTHHQMMIAGDGGEVMCIADRAKNFLSADPEEKIPEFDTEVVYYEKTKSLCYQPHPEYVQPKQDCVVYFFDLVNSLLSTFENTTVN